MILNPAIIALIVSSLLSALYGVYASVIGLQIIRKWDIESGSEQQLVFERKTYLISTVLTVLFVFTGLTLILFVHTADHIHTFFSGAMCAAGSLNVNKYGYPVLLVKLAAVFLGGLWLILNYLDGKTPDYPLIRVKYKLLPYLAFLLVADAYLTSNYFIHMEANVITSCCGVLFGESAGGISGLMVSLPVVPAKVLFYLSVIVTVRAGIHYYRTGNSVFIFAALSAWLVLISILSVISFISVYYYELPTHHCPFCVLQSGYNFIGYPLYLSLLVGGIAGTGTGVLELVKGPISLEDILPDLQRKLCLVSMVGFVFFAVIATYPIVFSDFKLTGY